MCSVIEMAGAGWSSPFLLLPNAKYLRGPPLAWRLGRPLGVLAATPRTRGHLDDAALPIQSNRGGQCLW